MKKILTAVALSITMFSAHALTFWHNGVLMGNVCRNGAWYTVYPLQMAQPIGTTCAVRDVYGNFMAYGIVTNE